MKRIAFLVNFFPQKYATYVTYQILNALNAGYDVRIFPQIYKKLEDASQPELIKRYGLMEKIVKPAPHFSNKIQYPMWMLETLKNGHSSARPYFIKALNPFLFGNYAIKLFMFRKVAQFYGNLNFDIFHCHFGPNGVIAAGLKEIGLLHGKIITTFHGIDAHCNYKHLKKHYHSRPRTWSRLLFKHSDLFTTNTPYLLKQVVELGADPNKIELMPMGVDSTYFVPPASPHKKKKIQLLSVGKLIKLKGHHLGIQAVHKLIRNGYELEYIIIGEGVERGELQKLIEKLNITHHVKMVGNQTQSEIKKCMQASDIFLMTSVFDDTMRRETQGVVTAEAQACGLPVVAFRSGGVPYTIEEGKTGFLAEEKSVTEFTNHLKKLCTDEKLRKNMGYNARKFIENNFCLTKLAQKQLSLYERVLLK